MMEYFDKVYAKIALMKAITTDPSLDDNSRSVKLLILLNDLLQELNMLERILQSFKYAHPKEAHKADILQGRLSELRLEMQRTKLNLNVKSL